MLFAVGPMCNYYPTALFPWQFLMQQENTLLRPTKKKKKKICQTNNHLTNIRSKSTTGPLQHITQVSKTTQVLNLQPAQKRPLMSQWFPQQQFPVFGAKKADSLSWANYRAWKLCGLFGCMRSVWLVFTSLPACMRVDYSRWGAVSHFVEPGRPRRLSAGVSHWSLAAQSENHETLGADHRPLERCNRVISGRLSGRK